MLLAEGGELRGQALKTRLEDHYDAHVEPSKFYDSLEALERTGHVERRTDGLQDVYALTEAGERAMLEHLRWVTGCIETGGARRDDDRGESGE